MSDREGNPPIPTRTVKQETTDGEEAVDNRRGMASISNPANRPPVNIAPPSVPPLGGVDNVQLAQALARYQAQQGRNAPQPYAVPPGAPVHAPRGAQLPQHRGNFDVRQQGFLPALAPSHTINASGMSQQHRYAGFPQQQHRQQQNAPYHGYPGEVRQQAQQDIRAPSGYLPTPVPTHHQSGFPQQHHQQQQNVPNRGFSGEVRQRAQHHQDIRAPPGYAQHHQAPPGYVPNPVPNRADIAAQLGPQVPNEFLQQLRGFVSKAPGLENAYANYVNSANSINSVPRLPQQGSQYGSAQNACIAYLRSNEMLAEAQARCEAVCREMRDMVRSASAHMQPAAPALPTTAAVLSINHVVSSTTNTVVPPLQTTAVVSSTNPVLPTTTNTVVTPATVNQKPKQSIHKCPRCGCNFDNGKRAKRTPRVLRCGHTFCSACLRAVRKPNRRDKCPQCGEPFIEGRLDEITVNRFLQTDKK